MPILHRKDGKFLKTFFFTLFVSCFSSTLSAEISQGLGQSFVPSSTNQFRTPIKFESDNLEYRQNEQVITASGNVKVEQSSYTFYSDYALFNIPGKSLSAWGLVRFSDAQGNEINSKSMYYNADKGSARLLDAKGSFGPWLFAADRVERDDQGNFTLKKAKLSTCEADLSKYHLYGYRINILPKKRLTVYHALFRLGPVPILYLPYYYYSLGEKHLAFQIFPGNNQSEGTFVRTVWGYPFTDETYGKLYLDALTRRGTGTGGEFTYYYGDRVKGSVYGYRIFDKQRSEERWNARLSHFQKISPHWILRSNINQLSDDAFPNDFFREDFNRIVRDFRSSVSMTYQKNNKIFRIFGERNDVFNQTDQKFFADELLAPKVEMNVLQSPLGFGGIDKIAFFSFSNRFAGFSDQGETLSRHDRRESDASLTLLKSFRVFSRKTQFAPKITVNNRWIDRPQRGEIKEHYVQRVTSEGTLRQKLGRTVDIDLTHTFVQRLQENLGDDRGREDHRLSFFMGVRPMDQVSLRFDTSHALPRNKGDPLAFLDRRNYQPLRGEISIRPRGGIEIFFREDYLLHDPNTGSSHPLSTQGEVTLGRRELGDDYYSFGTSYSSFRDHAFEIRQSARVSVLNSWKIEGSLRSLVFYENSSAFGANRMEFVEKEILTSKEWRCWLISVTFRERKNVREFLFNLELKLDQINREKVSEKRTGSEWYPWRRGN